MLIEGWHPNLCHTLTPSYKEGRTSDRLRNSLILTQHLSLIGNVEKTHESASNIDTKCLVLVCRLFGMCLFDARLSLQ